VKLISNARRHGKICTLWNASLFTRPHLIAKPVPYARTMILEMPYHKNWAHCSVSGRPDSLELIIAACFGRD
jgi:hypothetical protein